MRNIVLGLPLFIASATAIAAPVYLSCTVTSEQKEKQEFSLAVDEQNRKITHTGEAGSAFNAEGFFSVNKISYKNISAVGEIAVTQQYEIDRTDLSVVSTVTVESSISRPKYFVSTGTCRAVKPPKRKI